MAKLNYLSAQLRESAPYLKDAGWHDTAILMTAAADEIEALRQRIVELEADSALAQSRHAETPHLRPARRDRA
jgi:hypothetical protein